MPRRRRDSQLGSGGEADRPNPPVGLNLSKLRNYSRRLLQPEYWPELGRFAYRRLSGQSLDEHTAERARAVTARLAIAPDEALQRVGLATSDLRSFAKEQEPRWIAAQTRVRAARDGMGGGADVDLLYSLCHATGAVRVLETGVAYGWSSLAILSAIADRPNAQLISIDLPYLGANLDNLVGLAVPNDLRHCWAIRRGADRDELPGAIAELGTFDLAHYDSDKSYRGRLWAYPLIWEGLREGGLLISDDVEDNLAFLEFAQTTGATPLIVRAPNRDRLSGILHKAA